MHVHSMIEFVSRFFSRIWDAYVDETRLDPETLLSEIHRERKPPER